MTEEERQEKIARARRRRTIRRLRWAGIIALSLAAAAGAVFLLTRPQKATSERSPSGASVRTQPEQTTPPETEQTMPEDPKERVPEASVRLVCLGDNLMHNTVMWAGKTSSGGYDYRPLYQYIKPYIEAADIAMINQETIFVNDPNKWTNYPSFGGPTQIGDALIDTGFDLITHASNHCYDKYTEGMTDTINYWRKHPEITVLGIHDSQEDADTIRVIEKNGIRIAFLNYTYGTNVGLPPKSYMIDYLGDEEKIANDIARAKELSDIVIVFPHWGTENTYQPDDFQRKWGQFFADQGVGAVIGGHPHTLQPVELLTGRDGNICPVYWSLGNFISHMSGNQNMLGGMAELTISRDKYGVYISDYALEPTMTYARHDYYGARWYFYGMKLADYTDDMAAHHLIPHTSVEEMWALYHRIIPEAEQE